MFNVSTPKILRKLNLGAKTWKRGSKKMKGQVRIHTSDQADHSQKIARVLELRKKQPHHVRH